MLISGNRIAPLCNFWTPSAVLLKKDRTGHMILAILSQLFWVLVGRAADSPSASSRGLESYPCEPLWPIDPSLMDHFYSSPTVRGAQPGLYVQAH
jgi:hypothetical protein